MSIIFPSPTSHYSLLPCNRNRLSHCYSSILNFDLISFILRRSMRLRSVVALVVHGEIHDCDLLPETLWPLFHIISLTLLLPNGPPTIHWSKPYRFLDCNRVIWPSFRTKTAAKYDRVNVFFQLRPKYSVVSK